jgi:two-component system, cell cycle sensor histidine kinase and response regulator CckA
MATQKLIEQKIRSYEALFENANELIITTDKYGIVTKLNRKVEEVSGYSREELIGKSILVISSPESRKDFISFWKELSDGQATRHELSVTGKTGETGYLFASGSIIKEGEEILEMQYNALLITDLKEAQETIISLKNHLKSIIESSPNMIICLDSSGLVEITNPVTEGILQVSLNELNGRILIDACPFMKKFNDALTWALENKTSKFLMDEVFPDSNTYNLIIYPLTASPKGGIVITAVNITEKKKMQAELIHAQKMETIGLLASGFAHDFNNILTGIVGNIAMMRLSSEESKKQKYLDTMDQITNRAKDLISQLLMLSSNRGGNPQNFSVKKALNEVIDLTSRSINKNIRLKLEFPKKGMIIKMDFTQFTQVMLNLIINARDAIGKMQDGLITINAQNVWVDEQTKRHNMLHTTGNYIRLDVMDNGCGIDQSTIGKIFDPFFTTKDRKEGSGLGLSITYKVVKNAGGNIKVSSEKGKGSRFTVILPLSAEMIEDEGEENTSIETMKGISILLVDDEPMIRDIGREILESIGHNVTTASNGIECLELLSSDENKYDVVILDMIMPGLDGFHTLAEMNSKGIDKKVIVSTGFHAGDEFNEITSNPLVIGSLNKPFTVHELTRVLSKIFS